MVSPEASGDKKADPSGPVLVTWESEVRAMAADAVAWTAETGGDLFGLWANPPVIYLVTRAGPAAVRDAAHFRLDVDYLRGLSQQLAASWGIRYLGDWHSHHRLGLTAPSAGDRRRIAHVAARNAFPAMVEIIVTLEDSARDLVVARLHPWVYGDDKMTQPMTARLQILPGLSPVRDTLIARNALPEQQMQRWSEIPAQRIVGSTVRRDLESDDLAHLYDSLVERLIDHTSRALEEASGGTVERHATAFGTILTAPVDDARLVAFAVSREWPCPVLEVDWIDRTRGTAEPIRLPQAATLRSPAEVVSLYHVAQQHNTGSEVAANVDQGAT